MNQDSNGPSWIRSGRIPGLDGLRAVAILLVLVGHVATFQLSSTNIRITRLGEWGVDLFFAISGFLITLLLLREYERKATIGLPNFYLRRAIRILPPYLFFLLIIFLMEHAIGPFLTGYERFGLLTFTLNWMPMKCEVVGHVWSLCIEEQFYLTWPLLLLLLGPQRSFRFAIGWVLVTPLIRQLFSSLLPEVSIYYHTFTRLDGLLAGCIVAIMASGQLGWSLKPLQQQPGRILLLLVLLLFILRESCEMVAALQPFYHSGTACIMAAIVWVACSSNSRQLLWWLESRPMVTIGLLSYSLYLWHQPFNVHLAGAWWATPPWNLIGILCIPVASYLLLEKPLMKWRSKLRASASKD